LHSNLPEKKKAIMAIPPEPYRQKIAKECAGLHEQQAPGTQEMKHSHLPSGLQRGIPFIISADWSAEEALAVFEILNDLREVIWNRYQFAIQDLLKEQRCLV